MRKNLYLYLALACFLGLITIFVFDGYMGVYDTIYITTGGQEQKLEADFWSRDTNTWYTGVAYGEEAFFRYEVDNRRFQSYSADVEVSVWRSQQKVLDLLSEQIQIDSFDSEQLEWVVDTVELDPVPPERGYEYTLIIKRGEIERRIILYLNNIYLPRIVVPEVIME